MRIIRRKGVFVLKKLVAFALVMVLVLGLCASAFASYYPTATFASSSKSQYVRYGKTLKLKVNWDSGTGPFNWVTLTSGSKMYRAGYTIVIKKGSQSTKVADIDFTGHGTRTTKVKTRNYSIIRQPGYFDFDKYKATVTSYYRLTSGYTVYTTWYKNKSKNTSFWVYR